MKKSIHKITFSAIIAATYIVLTLPFASVSFGPIQFRIAEALTLLPFVSGSAIPGLFIGCFASNILFSTPLDAVFGSIATLIAAFLTYKSKNLYVSALPPVFVNGIMISIMLAVISGEFSFGLLLSYFASISLSQAVICFLGGVTLVKILQKYNINKYFKN